MPRNRVTGLGSYNAICDVCGFKFKASELSKRWDGAMVDRACFETRHPQEFVRARPARKPLKLTRPDSTDFLTYAPEWTLFEGEASDFWQENFWEANFWADGFWSEGSGSSASAGNSTITGTYTEIPDAAGDTIVTVSIYIIIGSTAEVAPGAWTISVPRTNGNLAATGAATFWVQGTHALFGTVTLPALSTLATIRSTATGEQWSDTVPHTISEGDRLAVSIRYSTAT